MKLLTTDELREFLRLKTLAAAKRMADRLGVKPIQFGPGAGLGARWVREEVEKALLVFRDGEPKHMAEVRRRKRKKSTGFFDGPYPKQLKKRFF